MQHQPPREDLSPWFVTLDDLDGVVEWAELFGNDQEVELDIGCGRGWFLYYESLAHPERNYLGIEIDYREGRRTARRLQKRNASNARVWGGNAHAALLRHIPPGSVTVAHVYFPDPWWKRKHRKRRLFTDEFVNKLVHVLRPGGVLFSASDVGEYFEIIAGLMNHDRRFTPLPDSEFPIGGGENGENVLTSYERKARQRAETIHRGQWRLRSDRKP